MKKDPFIYLEHILESIESIESYIEKSTKARFLKSKQLQDSVIRRIEIIGEAVKNIPENIKIVEKNLMRFLITAWLNKSFYLSWFLLVMKNL